ncbi:hypothetical protein LXA43DRAFT_1100725 [Ganoderma leucocontextum]|nr:hypothetical protein LXA43DRAFT_1100725 [Ganoderma leucocontextum]
MGSDGERQGSDDERQGSDDECKGLEVENEAADVGDIDIGSEPDSETSDSDSDSESDPGTNDDKDGSDEDVNGDTNNDEEDPKAVHATFSEEIQGLQDCDLDNASLQPHTSGKGKHKSLVSLVADAEVFGDKVITPAQKKKCTQTKVSSEESRGYDGLPPWNLWDLDEVSGSRFLELLSSVLKAAYPDRTITLDKGDKIYKFARQHVYNWRKGFQTLAIKLVELWQFTSDARAAGGEALYDTPNIKKPKDVRGAMQLTYIAKLLASHLDAIEGGRLKTSLHHGGALVLATVAMCLQDVHNCLFMAEDMDFSQKMVGLKTKKMYEGSVKPLIVRPAQMDALIDAAWAHTPYVHKEAGDENGGNGGNGTNRYWKYCLSAVSTITGFLMYFDHLPLPFVLTISAHGQLPT